MSIRALLFPPAARPGSPVWQPQSRAGQAATCVSFPVPLPRCWCKAGEETTLSFCAQWLSAVPAACQGRCPPALLQALAVTHLCHVFLAVAPVWARHGLWGWTVDVARGCRSRIAILCYPLTPLCFFSLLQVFCTALK